MSLPRQESYSMNRAQNKINTIIDAWHDSQHGRQAITVAQVKDQIERVMSRVKSDEKSLVQVQARAYLSSKQGLITKYLGAIGLSAYPKAHAELAQMLQGELAGGLVTQYYRDKNSVYKVDIDTSYHSSYSSIFNAIQNKCGLTTADECLLPITPIEELCPTHIHRSEHLRPDPHDRVVFLSRCRNSTIAAGLGCIEKQANGIPPAGWGAHKTNCEDYPPPSSSDHAAIIMGIAFGGIALTAAMLGAVVYCIKRNNRQSNTTTRLNAPLIANEAAASDEALRSRV